MRGVQLLAKSRTIRTFLKRLLAMQQKIEQALSALCPLWLEVKDESHQHSRGEQTHFKATVVSAEFAGSALIKRHQRVYACLGDLMRQFHALALHTYTPEEWQQRQGTPDSPRCRGGSLVDK